MTVLTQSVSYNDDIVKKFTLASIFWGIVGFFVGVLIASQLAFPQLNLEPYLNFGRLRPSYICRDFCFWWKYSFCDQLFCGAKNLSGTLGK
jgi:cbb3-type cytochrome oxidase subunit 1